MGFLGLCATFRGCRWKVGSNNTVVLSRSLLADDRLSPMKLLNLSDCSSKPLLPRDAVHYDWGQKWVSFLPDGRHFLFAGLRIDRQHDVRLGTLGSPATELLVRDASDPRYVEPGYTFFFTGGVSYLLSPSNWTSCAWRAMPVGVLPQQLDFGGWEASPAMTSPAPEHSLSGAGRYQAQTVSGRCLRYANGNAGSGKCLHWSAHVGRRKEVADK